MRKAAQELSPEMRIRAIKPKGTVITVGEGRGFVVEHGGEHLVVTASHWLPWLPSGFGISYSEEHVYRNMLGPLGSTPTVACECLFINPIADVAVVGVPDTQTFSAEADVYRAFLEYATPFRITEALEKARGFLLSLEGEWFGCQVQWMQRIDGPLWNRCSLCDGKRKRRSHGRIRRVEPTINARSAALAFADPGDEEAMTTDIPDWIPSST